MLPTANTSDQEIEHKDDDNIKNRSQNSYIATFNNKIVTGSDIYNYLLGHDLIKCSKYNFSETIYFSWFNLIWLYFHGKLLGNLEQHNLAYKLN